MVIVNRVLAPVLALALLALGLLVVVEVVSAEVFGRSPLLLPYSGLADQARAHTWEEPWMRALSAGLAALGALLVFSQLARRRPGLLLLAPIDERTTTGLPRRALAVATAQAAVREDGISSADAVIGRRRVTVKAISHLRDTTGLSERLEGSLRPWLDELGLAKPMTLRVQLTRQER